MDNIQNHGNDKRLEKEKQKLRAAKTVYKDGTKTHKSQANRHKQKNPTSRKLQIVNHKSKRRPIQIIKIFI